MLAELTLEQVQYIREIAGLVKGNPRVAQLKDQLSTLSQSALDELGKEDAVLKKHPLLVPTLRTGGYAACAVFTLFTVLSLLEGTPDFERAFVGAAIAGVVGLLEGYRRALRRHANRGESEPERAIP